MASATFEALSKSPWKIRPIGWFTSDGSFSASTPDVDVVDEAERVVLPRVDRSLAEYLVALHAEQLSKRSA